MDKVTKNSILEHIREQATDILGYVPNDNDLYCVLLNVLDDMQDRIVEYADHCIITYDLNDMEVK